MRVLIVDNDSEMLEATARALRDGFSIDAVTGKADALDLLRQNDFHVVVACERLNDGSGLDLLSQTAKRWPQTIRLFAATADRISLLRGRLGPFKLFQTLDYPINPGQLGSVLMLAQAAQAADADTTTIQHIVMGESGASEVDAPTQTVAVMPAQNVAAARASPRPLPFSVPTVNPPPDVPLGRRKPVTRDSLAHGRQPATPVPSRPPPSHPTSAAFAPPVSATQRSRILERLPPPPGQPRDAVTEEVPTLTLSSMRLEPIPEGIGAYRTQIMIGGAATLVLLAVGIGIYLTSGDADAPATPAPTAAVAAPAQQAPASAAEPIIAEIETALTRDDTGRAKAALSRFRELHPNHPRLAFFDAIVSRRDELERASARAARETVRAEERAAAALAEAGEAAAPLSEPPPSSDTGSAAAETPAPVQQAAPESPPVGDAASGSPPATPSSFTGRTLETTDASGATTAAVPPAPTAAAVSPPPASAPARRGSTDPDSLPPVVREAKLVRRSSPDYPPEAMREGKQGSVEISFVVTSEGRVSDAVVVASTDRAFERAALNAVRRWRYEPRIEDGRPVDWRTQVHITFKLSDN